MGTTIKAGQKVSEEGLRPVDRSYLHLSMTREIAESRSHEPGEPCVVEVEAKRAFEEGGYRVLRPGRGDSFPGNTRGVRGGSVGPRCSFRPTAGTSPRNREDGGRQRRDGPKDGIRRLQTRVSGREASQEAGRGTGSRMQTRDLQGEASDHLRPQGPGARAGRR